MLEAENGVQLDLDSYLQHEQGFQVLSGLTGFGLPQMNVQWLETAGHGAKYRSKRALPRDIDLPLLLEGKTREGLRALVDQLSQVLSGEVTLRFYPDEGEPDNSFYVKCHRTGGGSYVYGRDSIGETDLIMWITLRAGDPFWKASEPTILISRTPSAGSFLSNLVSLNVSGSQLTGTLDLDNPGTADAYPVWKVRGPFSRFRAVSPQGEVLEYNYPQGHVVAYWVYLDTENGTCYRPNTMENLYHRLAPAPKFWAIPPGGTTAEVIIDGAEPGQTTLTVEWYPRYWMVV